ncbi:hypothetical protein JYU34_016965 [Plutella xylostella]|uniref:Uncharacterized protein n=1 Tax=Plutella xylostella TaxID=51655 RepID=A0ABQ7Q3Z6_PLUXY|nr:hypothetical protein JYU34_016965 [Plutella xylostella]
MSASGAVLAPAAAAVAGGAVASLLLLRAAWLGRASSMRLLVAHPLAQVDRFQFSQGLE